LFTRVLDCRAKLASSGDRVDHTGVCGRGASAGPLTLTGRSVAHRCPFPLRLVEIDDPDQDGTTCLTSHPTFGATTIAALYKERWRVELFFEALTQNLKIKTFVGTTTTEAPQILSLRLGLYGVYALHVLRRTVQTPSVSTSYGSN
jgi:hypothetical protein